MPLTMVGIGSTGCITRISGKDETRKFLASLGFVIGQNITVVSELAGNVIINVKDSRVALDRTMANRIFVG